MKQIEQLSPVAKRAWKRLESDFPSWAAHLDARDGRRPDARDSLWAVKLTVLSLLSAFFAVRALRIRGVPALPCA
jgi:hypothetical protein